MLRRTKIASIWPILSVLLLFGGIGSFAQDTQEKSYLHSSSSLIELIKRQNFIAAEESIKQSLGQLPLDPFENLYSFREINEKWDRLEQALSGLLEMERQAGMERTFNPEEYSEILDKSIQILERSLPLGELSSASVGLEQLQAVHRLLFNLSRIKAKTRWKKRKQEKKENSVEQSTERDEEADNGENEGEGEGEGEGEENDDNNRSSQKDDSWEKKRDQYQPHLKPVETDDTSEKPTLLVETDAPVENNLMANHIFDLITAEGWSRVPVGRRNPYKAYQAGAINEIKYSYKVHSLGKNNLPLLLPAGLLPLTNSSNEEGWVLEEKGAGEFILKAKTGKLPPMVDLTLVRQELDDSPSVRNFMHAHYLNPTGIHPDSWPREILGLVSSVKTLAHDPLKRIQAVAQYIHDNFKYYSPDNLSPKESQAILDRIEKLKQQGDPVPVAFAKSRILQCDGAAWIVAALARDFLGIPARVKSGRKSEKRGDMTQVKLKGSLHAWAEVWIDGKGWVEIDATPPNQLTAPPKKDTSEAKEKAEGNEQGNDQGDKQGNEQENEEKKGVKQDGDQMHNDVQQSSLFPDPSLFQQRLAKFPRHLSAFIKERIRHAASKIGAPREKREELMEIIKDLDSFSQELPEASKYLDTLALNLKQEIHRLELEGEKWSAMDQNSFQDMLQENLNQNRIEDVYYQIRSMEKDMKFLAATGPLTSSQDRFHQFLKDLLERLKEINHPDANAYNQVKNFWRKLPGPISSQYLREKYGMEALTLGHPSNLQLAADLASKSQDSLASLQALTNMGRFTNLWLNTSRKPGMEKLYIGAETHKKQLMKVLLPLQNWSDLTRAHLPLKNFEDTLLDCAEGKVHVLGHRRPELFPRPHTQREEIFTLALVDESGSMKDERTKLAQSMVVAFMDKARKQNTGNVVHNLAIIPFTDRIGDVVMVTNDQEARNYLNQFLLGKPLMDGGTDIQAALIKAYEEIAKAFQPEKKDSSGTARALPKKKVDLRKANIWLLTDGGSRIDPHKVQEARNKIPQNVQIHLNVIFIGEKNHDLEKYLTEKNPDHPEIIQYIPDSALAEALSPTPQVDDDKAFATAASTLQIRGSLLSDLRRTKSAVEALKGHSAPALDWPGLRRELDWNRNANTEKIERNLELEALLDHLAEHKGDYQKSGLYPFIIKALYGQLKGEWKTMNPLNYKKMIKILEEN